MKGKKVVSLTNLRRSMTLKSQTSIRLRHATTVINYLYRSTSGIHHQHIDGVCTSIDGILHQLFNNRSWPLNYLSCGYLVGYTIW